VEDGIIIHTSLSEGERTVRFLGYVFLSFFFFFLVSFFPFLLPAKLGGLSRRFSCVKYTGTANSIGSNKVQQEGQTSEQAPSKPVQSIKLLMNDRSSFPEMGLFPRVQDSTVQRVV